MTRVKDLPIPGSISPSDVVVMDVTVGGVGPVTCKVPLSMLFGVCAAQNAPQSLTDATSIVTDATTNSTFTVTLTANRTLANPTNLVDGSFYIWYIYQDAAGGHTLAFGTMFKWPGGTAPTVTATANALTIISAQYIASKNSLFASAALDVK